MTSNFSTPETEQSQRSLLFNGEIKNTKFLLPILKSINIDKFIEVAITEFGIKFICENDRSIQATSFIDRNLFTKYEMQNESTPQTLRILTVHLLNVLSFLLTKRKYFSGNKKQYTTHLSNEGGSLSSTSTLLIKYYNDKRLKIIVISNDRLFSSCMQTIDAQRLNIWTMAFVNRITLDASVMRDFWKFVDPTSEYIAIEIKNSNPWFIMSTKSELGKFSRQIDASSTHVEHYECTVPSLNHYRMRYMKYTIKPLLLADKINIRFSSTGLLNIQYFIPLNTIENNDHLDDIDDEGGLLQVIQADSGRCFVEFYIIPTIIN